MGVYESGVRQVEGGGRGEKLKSAILHVFSVVTQT